MPIPPPSVTAPYDTVNSCLNTARVRMNDAIESLGGDILTDSQPFTQQMTNDAWRKLQAFLANLGFSRYKRKFWALGMPPIATLDFAAETFWSWTQFYNGVAYLVPPTVTVLPQDLILPLRIGERPAGQQGAYRPMRMAPDGLPEGPKVVWNRYFEWKYDAIYMPGSTYSMDFEVEYAAYDQDFVNVGDPNSGGTWWYNLQVPIMRCRSALANYICAEAAYGRDDMDVSAFITQAETDAKLIFNTEVKLKQRTPVSRRPYGRSGNGWRLNGQQGY
jgi:hypothetical protein